MPGLLGKKIGMSQIIEESGKVIPVTYVYVEPNVITRIKTDGVNGVDKIILGLSKLKKPLKTKKFKYLKEFKIENPSDYEVGKTLTVELLKDIKNVKITSISKGKGFQGVMKKYNFGGGPKTHGSTFHRKPGSVGACAEPAEVAKGKKMPGQMGDCKVTLESCAVVEIDIEKNVLAIKGPLPGSNNTLIIISY